MRSLISRLAVSRSDNVYKEPSPSRHANSTTAFSCYIKWSMAEWIRVCVSITVDRVFPSKIPPRLMDPVWACMCLLGVFVLVWGYLCTYWRIRVVFKYLVQVYLQTKAVWTHAKMNLGKLQLSPEKKYRQKIIFFSFPLPFQPMLCITFMLNVVQLIPFVSFAPFIPSLVSTHQLSFLPAFCASPRMPRPHRIV